MNLTSAEIFNIVFNWVQSSALKGAVPNIYADHAPQYPSNRNIKGEFIVINTLSNAIGEGQVATLNVNIYVPDLTPRENAVAQRYPNRERLAYLTRLAYEVLQGYPVTERWYFDVSSENIISDREMPYSFANIKLTFKNF
jgi:hypothetical protein